MAIGTIVTPRGEYTYETYYENGVLWHEWTHAMLQDSGLANGLNHELEEALCDAVSSALMRVIHHKG